MPRYVREDPEVVPAEEVVAERGSARPMIIGWFYTLSAWVAVAGIAVFTLLALRMGFMMGDANPRAGFVDFIYDITGPLAQPFENIMRNRILDGGGIFEPATAIAMGIYLIATIFAVLVLWALAPRWLLPAGREGIVRRRVIHQP